MAEQLQQIVERVVARVFEQQLPKLQAELVASVLAEMPTPSPDAITPPASQAPNGLASAVASIHAGSTQKEILKSLLDAASIYSSRVALFVVKSGAASGWQSRGLGDDEAIKDFPLDMSSGPSAHAYQNRVVAPANIAEMDRRFVTQFGGPDNEQILVLPLVLKDKVAALLYADGGSNGVLDAGSLEVLVMAASAWLEVASLRKQAQTKEVSEPAISAPMSSPVQAAGSYSDPFAGHVPKHTAVMSVAEPAADVVEAAAPAAAAAAPAVAKDPLAEMSPEDADTHRKAQRFARLLVDEIKLYNQAKVAEGRRNKDLYDRLKDDIEKSRTTFQKRYGNTVAASADYFQKEAVRSLAEDDAAVMGPNFRR
jgi:hypothetical protein